MFGKKTREIQELRSVLSLQRAEISQLQNTRIRVSVPTELGVKPILDNTIVMAILYSMTHGTRDRQLPNGAILEVISGWRPEGEDYDE